LEKAQEPGVHQDVTGSESPDIVAHAPDEALRERRLLMTDWPSYSIGPRESIFALGVISAKFVELESVLEFIFGTILRLDQEQSRVIFARLGCESCLKTSNDCLAETGWADDVKDQVAHFLKAVSLCADNRNWLMHSHVAWRFGEQTILFRTSRSGGDLSSQRR
jgi:hypothetical protein